MAGQFQIKFVGLKVAPASEYLLQDHLPLGRETQSPTAKISGENLLFVHIVLAHVLSNPARRR